MHGSRASLERRVDNSYEDVLPQVTKLQQVYGQPQSRGKLSNSTSITRDRIQN
jgi:hypothetical protein